MGINFHCFVDARGYGHVPGTNYSLCCMCHQNEAVKLGHQLPSIHN